MLRDALTCIPQQHNTQLGGSQVAHKIHGTDPEAAKTEAEAEADV